MSSVSRPTPVTLQVLHNYGNTSSQSSQYTYKVRIVNPSKKTDFIIRQLHHFNTKFDSVFQLRATLVNEFKEQVPDSTTFRVGYIESHKNRISIVTSDDIRAMYANTSHEITLWCDARVEDAGRNESALGKRKRGEDRESEVEEIYMELKEKHDGRYENGKLRLWARMIGSSIHSSREEPPDIPAFRAAPKRKCTSNPSSTTGLAEAAVVLAQALNRKSPPPNESSNFTARQVAEVRMKNFEQLKVIQELLKDGILTEKEFKEQKENILDAIRNL